MTKILKFYWNYSDWNMNTKICAKESYIEQKKRSVTFLKMMMAFDDVVYEKLSHHFLDPWQVK